MKNNHLSISCKYFVVLLFTLMAVSCRRSHGKLSAEKKEIVKGEVTQLTTDIARDVTDKGPAAWLDYFEDSSDFFMASDGGVAFNNYQSAKEFILTTLVKTIPHIKLQWRNTRIDPFTPGLASIGADFHEELTDANNKTLHYNGYFTGIARRTDHGWKLRNAHWSIKPAATVH